ncbi:MAG: rhodanese-like domain-containing protein [Microbacterium sp.]
MPELASLLAAGAPVRLLDVRWRLDQPEGRPAYLAGHLPGAVYVDLERELTDPGHPEEGRHPLPRLSELEGAARRWGLREGDVVVAYDDNDGVPASRAWWLLRRRGIDIRVLDGGVKEWARSGELLERGDLAAAPGNVTLDGADPGIASIEDAARAPHGGLLLDVRSPQNYRGVASVVDPLGGHIPGAVNLPTVIHLGRDGRLVAPSEIVSALVAAGHAGEPIVVYCSSGIASAHTALALATAGIDARVFPGGWSQWSRTSGRPVAVGPTSDGEVYGGWRSESARFR